MKKKILLISSVLLTLIIVVSIVLIINKNDANEIVMEDNNKLINNSFLTLMIEQEDGTYLESTSNTWPGDGYIFNSELSACQNGGELDYDSETNKVILYSNKSDGCYVYFDIYNKPVINSINLTESTNNSITISVSVTEGTNSISNYYYIINDETPVSTTNNTYTFSGLNGGTTYTIKVYVVDSEGYSSDTSSLNVETESIVYLANYIKNIVYQGDGVNGLYYHDGQGTYVNAELEAGDNSYRYAGENPNNYVCFGSDAATCPSDNLYRIIGVFENEVKLIKSTSYGEYYWSGSNSNTSNVWSNSTLNTSVLNGTYLNSLESMWRIKLSDHRWMVGGIDLTNATKSNAYNTYRFEVGADAINDTYNSKIGLIYISDYYYGAIPTFWTYPGYNYDGGATTDYRAATESNWLFLGSYEWTISYSSDSIGNAYRIHYSGHVFLNTVGGVTRNVRPCFYLKSDVQYISGTGTESDPIRIQ